ncbi:acyltransferase [Rhodococcoides fascians]|uniref:acyltransferase n=1 Tax=Rhodococcoides fascians TaxID=1828 RepID=UPI00353012C0
MKLRGVARTRQGVDSPFIGAGVQIRAKSKIKFGKNVTLDQGSFVDAQSVGGVSLGDNVTLGRGSRIECTGSLKLVGVGFTAGSNVGLGTDNFYGAAGGIEIGPDTIVGNFTSFHSENHVSEDLATPIRLQGVVREGIRIGANCWIGARVTVLDGVILGDGSIVAAGAVLKAGNYTENGIYAGVPARLVRSRGVIPFEV